MADHFQASIEAIKITIAELETQVFDQKKLVNMLAAAAKLPPVYPDIQANGQPATAGQWGGPAIRPAEFYGKPLTSAIKAYLNRRKDSPATIEEIHGALVAGGYDEFSTKKEDALNGLRISMGKNAAVFARIPSGSDSFLYGLNEWYGITKRAKNTGNGKDAEGVGGSEAAQSPAATDGAKVTEEATEGPKGGDDA